MLGQVESGRRRAAGDGAGDVAEVAVAVGARTEDAVREHDRVRLRPRDVLAEAGPRAGQLVRRAGERGPRAQLDVGLHQLARGTGGLLRQVGETGVEEVEQADVERGRHAHPAAEPAERERPVEADAAVVDAAVDVRTGDVEQARRAHAVRDRDDHAHGERARRIVLAGEHRLVGLVEDQCSGSHGRPTTEPSRNGSVGSSTSWLNDSIHARPAMLGTTAS